MPSSRPPRRTQIRKRTSDAATRALITEHMSRSYRQIYDVVVRIPRGRVMTYGDVAGAAGMPRAARVVGYAMHAIGEHVPWQRVIGRRSARIGQVTIKDAVGGARQRQLLEKEGVRFSSSGGVDLEKYGWGAPPRGESGARARAKPPARARPSARAKPRARPR
jgi:methylated-DNA-protein-cysteine methyltransferase-like protein